MNTTVNLNSSVTENTTGYVDLVFVYDRSGSMTDDNVQTELDFIVTVIEQFNRTVGDKLQVIHHTNTEQMHFINNKLLANK